MTCIYVHIFAFGEYHSKQVNVSGVQIFLTQFLVLHLRKVMLNAANIYHYTHQMQIYIQVFCSLLTIYNFSNSNIARIYCHICTFSLTIIQQLYSKYTF